MAKRKKLNDRKLTSREGDNFIVFDHPESKSWLRVDVVGCEVIFTSSDAGLGPRIDSDGMQELAVWLTDRRREMPDSTDEER